MANNRQYGLTEINDLREDLFQTARRLADLKSQLARLRWETYKHQSSLIENTLKALASVPIMLPPSDVLSDKVPQ